MEGFFVYVIVGVNNVRVRVVSLRKGVIVKFCGELYYYNDEYLFYLWFVRWVLLQIQFKQNFMIFKWFIYFISRI